MQFGTIDSDGKPFKNKLSLYLEENAAEVFLKTFIQETGEIREKLFVLKPCNFLRKKKWTFNLQHSITFEREFSLRRNHDYITDAYREVSRDVCNLSNNQSRNISIVFLNLCHLMHNTL